MEITGEKGTAVVYAKEIDEATEKQIKEIMVNSEYGWERDDGNDDCEAIEKNNDALEKAVSRRKRESAEKATRGKEQ